MDTSSIIILVWRFPCRTASLHKKLKGLKKMITYEDYKTRKNNFEKEGRETYLLGDFDKFTSQTSEYLAFINNYINQLTELKK